MSRSLIAFLFASFVINRSLVSAVNVTSVYKSGILANVFIPLPSDEWKLSSHDGFFQDLPANVPGDLLTDLMSNGIIDDPYIDRNFLTQQDTWIGGRQKSSYSKHTNVRNMRYNNQARNDFDSQIRRTWIYSTSFELPGEKIGLVKWKLVLEGIKMGAEVFIDSMKVGDVVDQFLRYDFEIDDVLRNDSRQHNLTISFNPSISVNGRFSACSGGWDWSPYTKLQDVEGVGIFTMGIIKPIYIIGIGNQAFYISHVVPKIYYLGEYPRSPLHNVDGDFRLDVDVHLQFLDRNYLDIVSTSSIFLMSNFSGKVESQVNIPIKETSNGPSHIISISVTVPKTSIDLWWPNGMGKQNLYNIYIGSSDIPNALIRKRIGFRTTALVTINEDNSTAFDEAHRRRGEGSGQFGMYFRVNGAVVMARGANFIPMDQLEGRLSNMGHRILVQSASMANMNMIRIWGGGMIPPESFYEACDEHGILIYHDMMFVEESGHGAVKIDTVSNEIRHLVRSLSSHPSLLVWNGCNECQVVMGTASEIYADFVMKIVAEEDDTRPIWPSSPSHHGWKTGVQRSDSRPLTKGQNLTTWDPNSFTSDLETHGPYMRSFSTSYPGVNGLDVHFPYRNTPPTIKKGNIGFNYPNQFSSEFGSSTMSSFESMTGTITPSHWSLHGGGSADICVHDYGNNNKCNGTNVMAERNYPCDSHVKAYFGLEDDELSKVGSEAFKKQLYMCLIAQTLWMKGEIESRRSKNYFGLLIWQLNEVWPTGGWGVVEYGRSIPDGSQIFGGRWKSSLFADQIVACGEGDLCYIRNDNFQSVIFSVTFEAWDLQHSERLGTYQITNSIEGGSIQWFALPASFASDTQVIFVELGIKTFGRADETFQSVYLKSMPHSIKGLEKCVRIELVRVHRIADESVEISLRSNLPALFVVLTTRAQGVFSDNTFFLRPFEMKIITFDSMEAGRKVDINILTQSLRIEHLGQYMESSDFATKE